MQFHGWAHRVNLILASFDRLDNKNNFLIDKEIMVHSFWRFKPRYNMFSTF